MQRCIGGAACLFLMLFRLSSVNFAAINAIAQEVTHETQTRVNNHPQKNAKYKITLVRLSPLRFIVDADVPIDGKTLDMDDTYPADLPEMATNGWPLVQTSRCMMLKAKQLP